jgi:hypothetical protein
MESIKYLFGDAKWYLYPLFAFAAFELFLMLWQFVKLFYFLLGFKSKKKK